MWWMPMARASRGLPSAARDSARSRLCTRPWPASLSAPPPPPPWRPPAPRALPGPEPRREPEGRRLPCTTGPRGALQCRDGGPAPPYGQEVDRELALLRGYLSGPDPLYRVRVEGGGCYRLELLVSMPAPPYGRRARFCFDAATG